MTAAAHRRRWFRFSLRTLFVLLTIFCVWLGVQVKWIKDRHHAIDWLHEHDGGVISTLIDLTVEPPISWTYQPPLSLWVLGESGVGAVLIVPETKEIDAKIRELRKLFPEASVEIQRPQRVRQFCPKDASFSVTNSVPASLD